jgi:putative redox protein
MSSNTHPRPAAGYVVAHTLFSAAADARQAAWRERVHVGLTATSRAIPGTLGQEVVVDGRYVVYTDEPVRVGGGGGAPSPHELLPAALAACVGTSLVMYARTKSWDLGDVSVDVDYDHRSTPRRCRIEIRIGAELAGAQLERLERVAAACPVRRSLEGGVKFHERIVRDAAPAEEAA